MRDLRKVPTADRVEALRIEWQRQARNGLPGRAAAFRRYEEARAALLDAVKDSRVTEPSPTAASGLADGGSRSVLEGDK